MTRICFVCLGNICRSPTAEGIMQKLIDEHQLQEEVTLDSAGTGAWHVGHRADSRSRQAAKDRGVELTSRARQVTPEDFDNFDYLIAMDRSNLERLEEVGRMYPGKAKLELLRNFDPSSPKDAEVPDPYYGGPSGFDDVFDICERGCLGLLRHIHPALDL